MKALVLLIGTLVISTGGVQATARDVGRGKSRKNIKSAYKCADTSIVAFAVSSADLCDSCLLAVRVLEDALCDDEAVEFIVETATNKLCPNTPDPDECVELAQALLPVAIEWLRASATPASLCSAAGVCGAALLGDVVWDKAPGRLSDGLECQLCKHVVGSVQRDTSVAAAATSSVSGAAVRTSAAAACQQLPGELASACTSEMDKRGSLLRLAVGGAAAGNVVAACELMGMCLADLSRFRPPPLSSELVRHLAALSTALAGFQGRLLGASGAAGVARWSAVRDNRCDICKLAVLEVATLLANPELQQSIVTYAEAACDDALPPAYAPDCKSLVDTYLPSMFEALQQVLDPDVLCERVRLCTPDAASLRPGLFAVLGLRAGGGAGSKAVRSDAH